MNDYMVLKMSNDTGYHLWFVVPGSEINFHHAQWWHGAPQHLESEAGPEVIDLELSEIVDRDNLGISKCIPGRNIHNRRIQGKQVLQ